MLSIAIPSSSLITETDEKIKAYKVGIIARAAAIFRVDEILIYKDPIKDETKYIKDILEYLETPQYLRKYVIPFKDSLRFVGVLPPLAIPSHKTKSLKIGEIREGAIKYVAPDGTRWVDIGAKTLAPLKSRFQRGARVTVRVCSKNPLRVEEAKPKEYWGYKVKSMELKEIIRRPNAVLTSRKCEIVKPQKIRRNVTLIFGNPVDGVFEIANRLGLKLNIECWNTIPDQGTRSVRLEESILATLALINYFSSLGGGNE
ncbi:hypothetical protein DRP04_02540 [Archaeoglobales archaeon]|nr:MAG: hypothetical protein DRP04_02540 [Archaeoglobales archaeon]